MHKLLSAHALINKYEKAGTLTHTKKSIEKYVPTVLILLHTILYFQTGNNRVASRTSFYETVLEQWVRTFQYFFCTSLRSSFFVFVDECICA